VRTGGGEGVWCRGVVWGGGGGGRVEGAERGLCVMVGPAGRGKAKPREGPGGRRRRAAQQRADQRRKAGGGGQGEGEEQGRDEAGAARGHSCPVLVGGRGRLRRIPRKKARLPTNTRCKREGTAVGPWRSAFDHFTAGIMEPRFHQPLSFSEGAAAVWSAALEYFPVYNSYQPCL